MTFWSLHCQDLLQVNFCPDEAGTPKLGILAIFTYHSQITEGFLGYFSQLDVKRKGRLSIRFDDARLPRGERRHCAFPEHPCERFFSHLIFAALLLFLFLLNAKQPHVQEVQVTI